MKIFSKNRNYEKYYKDLVPYLKKEETQKYFYIILSISASIFFLIFAINPTLTTIANLKKQISDARFVNEKLENKVRSLSSLSQEYQIIQDDIPLVYDAIPELPQAPTLVGQISALGQDAAVEITNIEILPVNLSEPAASKSSNFAFEVSGNSDFISAQNFLDDLSRMQRVLNINSVQLIKNPEENNQINFIFEGLAYYKN